MARQEVVEEAHEEERGEADCLAEEDEVRDERLGQEVPATNPAGIQVGGASFHITTTVGQANDIALMVLGTSPNPLSHTKQQPVKQQ